MRCQIDRKNDLAQLCYVVTYIGNRKGYFKIYYVFFGEVRITLTISSVSVILNPAGSKPLKAQSTNCLH